MATNPDITFNGSQWQDLVRLVTRCEMEFLQYAHMADDDNNYSTEEAKCAYLVSHFRGPALDWAGLVHGTNAEVFNNFNNFVEGVKQQFGISDEGLAAQRRGELEGLTWPSKDLPVFFAEFDRITAQLGLTGHATKIALLRAKLPTHVQKLLAEQALNFANYHTMRERLLTMWSLDPNRQTAVREGPSSNKKRPRCGRCGKKGHTASDCRAKN